MTGCGIIAGVTLALEIAALVVLLLIIIGIAHYDDGPAGTLAKILVVLCVVGTVIVGTYALLYQAGVVGTPDDPPAHPPRDLRF